MPQDREAQRFLQHKAARSLSVSRVDEIFDMSAKAEHDTSFHTAFKMRFSALDSIYKGFETYHFKIISYLSTQADNELILEEQNDLRRSVDEKYFAIKSIYHDLFSRDSLNQSRLSRGSTSNAKLPKISIPIFSGDLHTWTNFLDLFTTLIDENSSLSGIEKFQYLLSSVSGQALSVIKGLPLSHDNYLVAFGNLKKRFNNKRLLATAFWRKIVDFPKIEKEDIAQLRELHTVFSENLAALDNLDFHVDQWCFPLFNIMIEKLDHKTRTRFELEHSSVELPTFETLKTFLISHCRALETCNTQKHSHSTRPTNFDSAPKNFSRSNVKSSFMANVKAKSTPPLADCTSCKQNHFIGHCPSFVEKTPFQRFSIVKQNNLCINCLKNSHNVKHCPSQARCKVCRSLHHSLLHFEKSETKDSKLVSSNPSGTTSNSSSSNFEVHSVSLSSCSCISNNNKPSEFTVLLSTAEIEILDAFGGFQKIRALMDNGSQASFITEKCLRKLGLSYVAMSQLINGIGNETVVAPKGKLTCVIRSAHSEKSTLNLEAYVLTKICSDMPNCSIKRSDWPHINNLKLADPSFHLSRPIDMLLSADIFAQILRDGRIKGRLNEPIAFNSSFGWILSGRIGLPSSVTPKFDSFLNTLVVENNSVDICENILTKFWELEEVPQSIPLSSEDIKCEKFFKETTYRDFNGRYIVSLPFSSGTEPELGHSRENALRRFYSLENRLSKNDDLKAQYCAFMREYLDSGHMSPVPPLDNSEGKYYIPHHCVIKPESVTTKLRVVFDASVKSSNGLSLNDNLLTGPRLQTDISSLLLRFRTHRVVFSGDIRSMFRQIIIDPCHRTYQRIFWRFSLREPVQEFILNTVTFGVRSSPFLALRTLRQLCQDEGHNFPLAVKILESDTYVDDVFGGNDTEEEALIVIKQLIKLLSRAGFELRKWISNKSSLLKHIPESSHQLPIDFDENACVKVLGLRWYPSKDVFSYIVHTSSNTCTKRNILSELARIFDPLGFLAPITFFAKHLMQQLWLLALDWDDTPPPEIEKQYGRFKSELPLLSSLEIPRCIRPSGPLYSELHGFCDASERGYGAIIYMRVKQSESTFNVFQLMAKSKVAPLKRVSIARLELCAAVLLAELFSFVLTTLPNHSPIDHIFAWSDSKVALDWIKSPSYRWKTFVANRVARIQEKVSPFHWHHIAGRMNPSDICSRGSFPSELVRNTLWWAGPPWLASLDSALIGEELLSPSEDALSEERVCVLNSSIQADSILALLDRFSSFGKIQRIITYCLKFVSKFSFPKSSLLTSFSISDNITCSSDQLSSALLFIVRHVQRSNFSTEISCLSKGLSCSKSFRKLSPFIDKNGLLRVGGRLVNSKLGFDQKFPLLLPRKHRLTELLILHYHEKLSHPGLRTLQFLLSQTFWILSPRRAIRNVITKCYRCFRVQPKTMEPLMGDLPISRVTELKPFSHVGCDFGGPFLIKLGKLRGSKTQKAYLCLFVCMSTKAIHLELVSDLSTECFLAAFRRFIARRGRCSVIYSDCGTNFVGASKYLQKIFKDSIVDESVDWKFNPPSSPHFGGLWESGIKSVKSHLHRVIGEQILTFEELYTVLVNIEALLNSRPLVEMSSDPNDLSVLTPGHFLTLEPVTVLPDPDYSDIKLNRLDRWQLLQRMQQQFWSRWHTEYLHTLTQRAKWSKNNSPKLQINQLVLIKDENLPPLKWRLGRIMEVHPGHDGICRVVSLKTADGVLRRPVVKLSPLPCRD